MPFTALLTGQLFTLRAMTRKQVLRLKLFSNDQTPSRNDTSKLYTDLIHPNYTSRLLTPSEWHYKIDKLTGNYTAVFAKQTWTFYSPVTVYGYMIMNTDGTEVLFAERFPNAPIILDGFNGKKIEITPVLGVQ